jgi:glycosyltransferase involved in cell wall biosynthesis
MRVSVVIPTHNRLEELRKVVDAVQGQARPPGTELEIVIVDDGSSDGTSDWLVERGRGSDFRVFRQPNSGPARARNLGVEKASGEIILFLGDDTEPQPAWLVAHLEQHRLFGGKRPLAVLGYTSFASDLDSPFQRYINEYGAQFGYQLIDGPCDVPFNFFYTSNISISRDELVRLGGFREDFPAAAWEDIELAYRAVQDGLKIRYEPKARTIHHHCVRPRTFCRRQRTSGRSAAIFGSLHPELGEFLGLDRSPRSTVLGRMRRLALCALVELGERVDGLVPHEVYQEFLDHCYLEGLADALHGK